MITNNWIAILCDYYLGKQSPLNSTHKSNSIGNSNCAAPFSFGIELIS